MRRFALSSLLMLLVGCAPSNPAMVIDGILSAPDNCVFSPSATAFVSQPALDTSTRIAPLRPLGITYNANLRVTNRLLSLFNSRYPLRADPNILTLSYAEVELLQVDGTPYGFTGLPNPFRVAASGTINAALTSGGVSGVVPVQVVPAVYGDALADQTGRILVSVRLTGATSGGASVTSGEFLFTLDYCPNCLVVCDRALLTTQPTCQFGQDRSVTIGVDTGLCP